MALLVVGSVGLDRVETPYGTAEEELGGSAVYFSFAASQFCPVRLVGVVGDDFPAECAARIERRPIDTSGLARGEGETFRWHGAYEGVGPAFTGDYLGATFLGSNPINTSADFKYYKLTFEEPKPSGNAMGGSLSSGILGLHFLDFGIAAQDGAGNRGVFDDSAPMFVLGYRIEQYAKGGLMYYIKVEWMDLDTVTLDGAAGEVMDLSGGVRWAIRGNKAALSVGYRKLDAELNIDGNQFILNMDGAIFSLFMRW